MLSGEFARIVNRVWDGKSVVELRALLEPGVSAGRGMKKAPMRKAVEPAELGREEVGAGGVERTCDWRG